MKEGSSLHRRTTWSNSENITRHEELEVNPDAA